MKIRVAIIWFLLTVAAFAQSGPFAATGGNQSLFVNVNGGTAAISTTPTVISAKTVLLTANSTNYIYVDLSAGTITSNTTGFTTTTYPIATAVTNATLVTSLVDDRPSAFNVAGTGGAGTITGSGTPGSLPIWVTSTTNLGNSNETEASNIFNVGTSGGMATSASGGLVFSGNLFSSTLVTVPTGYDFSLFTGSDNFFRCQLSVALGSGPCLNFSTIGGLASAAQIGDLSATYALQTQLTNAAQYSTPYYSAAGSANTLSGLSPAVTNGTWFPVQKVTASTAVAPVMQQFGMSTRSITGAATTDTVLYSDVGTVIAHDIAGSNSVTETLPTATTLANPNMVFSYANHSTHTDTITPTTWTIQVGTTAAAASMTVATGVTCRISVDANSATNWHADCANAAGASGAVSSVFTRTGAVVAAANDYTLDLIGSPAAAATFAQANFPVTFNSVQTTAAQFADTFTESTAKTGAGGGEVQITTLAGSTGIPLSITSSLTGTTSIPMINLATTFNNGSQASTLLNIAATNTSSGAPWFTKMLAGGGGTQFEFGVDLSGDVELAGALSSTAFGNAFQVCSGLCTANQNAAMGALTVQGGDNSSTGTSAVAGAATFRAGDETGAAAGVSVAGGLTLRAGNTAATSATATPGAASLSAGGFTAAATNAVGADLTLKGGLGTGTGTPSHVKIQTPSFGTASGTTAQTQVTRFVTHAKAGSTTTATATNMFQIPVGANQTTGVEVIVHVETTQATPHNCSTTEVFWASAQNTSATVTQQTTAANTLSTICDTGTLTLTATFSTATPAVFSVTPSWTVVVPTAVIITVEIHNLSQQDVTLL